MMRYLVTTNSEEPFYTQWYNPEDMHNELVSMVVYDLQKGLYTTDGREWFEIQEDKL